MPALALRDVHHRFPPVGGRRPVEALRGVAMTLEPGERAALAGPSGCGKSTLLAVAGLLLVPSAGEVLLDGKPATGLPRDERDRRRLHGVGLVFQRFHLHPALTARENVALPALEAGLAAPSAAARADELLSHVGLADRAHHRPGELSGGEQQRVAVARALVNRPALLLADEPTGELDAEAAALVREAIDHVWRERRFAMLVATHDASLAAWAGRTLPMQDGRILA
ncbi:MAG TPA: ABC transporter ATP-binding protein [Candidatus Thermoplasmatota archaeon]|nr:ABC transporter ATP-binding protein [Candidatus Thermoplasmatota archaeon]